MYMEVAELHRRLFSHFVYSCSAAADSSASGIYAFPIGLVVYSNYIYLTLVLER